MKWRSIAVIGAVVVLMAFSFVLWDFFHARPIEIPANDIEVALKGELGQVIFSKERPRVVDVQPGKTGLDALLAPMPQANNPGPGLIEDYKRDPGKFKLYAQMFDTFTNAKQLGKAILSDNPELRVPKDSTTLPGMPPNITVDAWGHPFCVMPVEGGIAVISGGHTAQSFSCAELKLNRKELGRTNRSAYQDSFGEIVVLTRRDS